MHKQSDGVHRIDIRATLSSEDDIRGHCIKWRKAQVHASCRCRYKCGITPHFRCDPMEGLRCLAHMASIPIEPVTPAASSPSKSSACMKWVRAHSTAG